MPAYRHAVNPRLSHPRRTIETVTTTLVTRPIVAANAAPRSGPTPMLVLVTRTIRYVTASHAAAARTRCPHRGGTR